METYHFRSATLVRQFIQENIGSASRGTVLRCGSRRHRRASFRRIGYPNGTPTKSFFQDKHAYSGAFIPAAAAPSAGSKHSAETSRKQVSLPKSSPQPSQPQSSQDKQQPHYKPRFRLMPEDPDAPLDRQLPEDNPSLDDIVLDEQYYKEMNLTSEDVQESLLQLDAMELDPEGENLGSGGLPVSPLSAVTSALPNPSNSFRNQLRTPSNLSPQQQHYTHGYLMEIEGEGADEDEDHEGEDHEGEEEEGEDSTAEDLTEEGLNPGSEPLLLPLKGFGLDPQTSADAEEEVYGPEAVVLAGFRSEEHGVVRALLDSAGGHVVKVLPVTEAMLYDTVEKAVHMPEQDWSVPRRQDGPRGGGMGSQRTVLFSGLSLRTQLTVLELLEYSGLMAVCAAVATEDVAGKRLGEVLAEAMAAQRTQANRLPKMEEPWRSATGRMADPLCGLTPLGDLIGEQARQRLQLHDQHDHAGDGKGENDDVPQQPHDDATAAPSNLNSFGLKAAEEAAKEWEAWRATKAAAGPSWGLNDEAEVAASSATADDGLGIGPHPGGQEAALKDFGVDLEQLREHVLRQLSDLDPDSLDELLVDSPYGDAAADALSQWREVQAADSGRSRAESAGVGPEATVDDVGMLAERQWRRWQEVQASLETAAAADGRLVVQTESMLAEVSPPPSPPLPSAAAAAQHPENQSVPSLTPTLPIDGAAAPPPFPSPSLTAKLSASRAATTVTGKLTQVTKQPQQHSPPSPPPLSHQEVAMQSPPFDFHPSSPPPSPQQPSFDFFSDESSPFSDLDDLLGQLESSEGSSGTTAGNSFTSAVEPLAEAPPPTKLSDSSTVLPGAVARGPGPKPRDGDATEVSAIRGATFASGIRGSAAGGVGSVLQQVQAAARSGAAPKEMQRILDERYGVSRRPTNAKAKPHPAGGAENANEAPPSRRRGSLFAGLKAAKAKATPLQSPQTSAEPEKDGNVRQRPRRSYGPSPPPEPDPVMKPLLELRPDIAQAVQDKKLQFLDMSRLSEKQKRQFVEYQDRMRLQQQQLGQQQQRQPDFMRAARATYMSSATPGGQEGVIEREGHGLRSPSDEQYGTLYGRGSGDLGQDEEADELEEGEDEDEDEGEEDEVGTVLDSEKLALLMEAAQQEGVSLDDTLAQAVVMGVRLPEEVLQEAGVSPPSEAARARAQEEYDKLFQEWASEQGLAMDAGSGVDVGHDPSVAEALSHGGWDGGSDSDAQVEKEDAIQLAAVPAMAPTGRKTDHSKPSPPQFPPSPSPGRGTGVSSERRSWGASLTARQRRPAQAPPSSSP